MALLSLRDVNKSYGSTYVLENVSLDVEAGEVVVIVGFSGAGKSTLISLLAGLDKPDSGAAFQHPRHQPLRGSASVLGPSPSKSRFSGASTQPVQPHQLLEPMHVSPRRCHGPASAATQTLVQ